MYEPTGGQIIFDGEDITKLEGAKLQPYHKRMQIIFQDPYSALDPHHNVEEIIREPMSFIRMHPRAILMNRLLSC